MSEETKKLWDLVKTKINSEGLIDVGIYFPEVIDEINQIVEYRKKVNNAD